MSTLVIVVRIAPLFALAGALLLMARGSAGQPDTRARSTGSNRAPLVANLAMCGLYFPSLVMFSASTANAGALLLALSGALLALGGVALVFRSRAALGQAWSLVPKADRATGLVTTGPYRLVRHPIYLGFIVLTTGEAIAFGSWAATAIVVGGIVPSFTWRALVEEQLLGRSFGERYADYRRRTTMIIPYLL